MGYLIGQVCGRITFQHLRGVRAHQHCWRHGRARCPQVHQSAIGGRNIKLHEMGRVFSAWPADLAIRAGWAERGKNFCCAEMCTRTLTNPSFVLEVDTVFNFICAESLASRFASVEPAPPDLRQCLICSLAHETGSSGPYRFI